MSPPQISRASFLKETGDLVGDLDVVQIGEREVRVATDAGLRQVHDRHVPAMLVDGIPPQPRHLQASAPGVLGGNVAGVCGNVVPIEDHDRDTRQCHEICHGHRHALDRVKARGNRRRNLALRKEEVAAGLEGDDRPDVRALDGGQPAGTAGLGVREQDAGSDPAEERCHAVRHDVHVEGAGVRRHGAEVLVQRFRGTVELHAVEVVRPDTDPELAEPKLLVGRRGDRGLDRAASRVAPPRLVDEIGGEIAAQEDVLEAFAAIRCGLPGLRELPGAMPHHDR
jgi:hypothetical protein